MIPRRVGADLFMRFQRTRVEPSSSHGWWRACDSIGLASPFFFPSSATKEQVMLMCFDLGEILVQVSPNWSTTLDRTVDEVIGPIWKENTKRDIWIEMVSCGHGPSTARLSRRSSGGP